MKVAIHQPQYIPWLQFFYKIDRADIFINLDTVSFQKGGVQNRNKILTNGVEAWLTVPVKHNLGQALNKVEINNESNWSKKHLSTLVQNYSKSKYFKHYLPELEMIYSDKWMLLSDLNFYLMKKILKWLDISTPIHKSSEMNAIGSGSELILNICKEVGASSYLSGQGGKNYMDLKSFQAAGITVEFIEPVTCTEYQQVNNDGNFIKDLSILDLLFNFGNDWRKAIRN